MSKKNWITWLLCGIMAITGASALTACGDNTDDSTPAASTPADSTPDDSAPDDSTPDDSTPAVKKYTIKFVDEDGTVISEESYDEGAAVVAPEDRPAKEVDGYRYAFSGWGEVAATATADATYTALYATEGVAIEYTISFNHPKTGMLLAQPITFTVETMDGIVFPEVPADLAQPGYTVAWDKTVEDVTLADMVVYPATPVAIEYTISFNHPKTGMLLAQPITFTVETMDSIVFPEVPADLAQPGYTVAWDKTVEDVTLSDLIVYPAAPVANTYQITYDANGGAAVEGQQVTFDAAYVVAEAPAREYYEFLGWYIVEDGVATETKLESGDAWAIADNVTVQAQWQFIKGEYAMKYHFNVQDNPITQITKQAYAGGSEVSFKYYIPEGTQAGWWGIAWNPTAEHANNYHAAGIEANYVGHLSLGGTTGAWIDVEFTLPEGGEYYLYFGAEVNPGNKWVLNGGNSYALIDDFKIGEATEDFNGGMEDSIFAVNVANAVTLGEGYVAPVFEEGEYAMKYVFNVSGETVSQVTKKAYPAGSKVSFKYFIPAGVNTKWWGICWSDKNTGLDIYAAATPASAYPLGVNLGAWTSVEFTLPATGGDYYMYFGSEVGNWKFADGSNAYVLIDDFKVGDEAENFNKPFEENSMFNVLVPGAVVLSEKDAGAPAPIKGNTMLAFEATAIGGYERVAMITGKAYEGVSEITFDAVWTGNATSARWGLSYTTDPSKFSYGAETSALNCYTPKLGEMKMDVGVQYTYKFTFEGGKYHLSAKAAGASEFTEIINGDYTEGANYFYIMVCPAVGGEGSIFYMDNFSITTASGTESDAFYDEKTTMFIESSTNTSDYGSSGMSFIKSTFEEETQE